MKRNIATRLISSLIFFSVLVLKAQALVPKEKTFQFVNNGVIGGYPDEYGATARYTGLSDGNLFLFRLCFYNTTPNNAFTLALGMGTWKEDTPLSWVWDANRGNPVGENATITFGRDGNLILADADGRIAWQTNTANKGVYGFKILSNGNMVLHDKRGKFVWQSFDYPTDTLLVGQSLKLGYTTKLVSRLSEKENANGPYSLVMDDRDVGIYYKSPNSPNPMKYFSFYINLFEGRPLLYFTYEPDFTLAYQGANTSRITSRLDRMYYNTTMSFLRLEVDGNVKIHSYEYDELWRPWKVPFALFSKDSPRDNECQMPGRCGDFGLCEDNQCVACPLDKGMMGWSKDCKPEKLYSCEAKDYHYYKLQDVRHFLIEYTEAEYPLKLSDCRKKCDKDCKCLGFFSYPEGSLCWIAYDLQTLSKVENSKYVAYIKAPNKKSNYII